MDRNHNVRRGDTGTQETRYDMGSLYSPKVIRGFDVAFAKLLRPHVLAGTQSVSFTQIQFLLHF